MQSPMNQFACVFVFLVVSRPRVLYSFLVNISQASIRTYRPISVFVYQVQKENGVTGRSLSLPPQGPWFESYMTAFYFCVPFSFCLLAPCNGSLRTRGRRSSRIQDGEGPGCHEPRRKIRCRNIYHMYEVCLLYTSPSPRDRQKSRMPSSA